MKKGQATIEFLFTSGAMIFILLLVLAMIFIKSIDLNKTSKSLKERDDCLRIANAITYSFIAGNNYTIKLRAPVTINPSQKALTIGNTTSCGFPIGAINNATIKERIVIEKRGQQINVR